MMLKILLIGAGWLGLLTILGPDYSPWSMFAAAVYGVIGWKITR